MRISEKLKKIFFTEVPYLSSTFLLECSVVRYSQSNTTNKKYVINGHRRSQDFSLGWAQTSGGFRGEDGGCIPHQPKSNDFGRKISLNFEKLGSISGRIPPTSLNLTISAEKSLSISVKTFFFFCFLETT